MNPFLGNGKSTPLSRVHLTARMPFLRVLFFNLLPRSSVFHESRLWQADVSPLEVFPDFTGQDPFLPCLSSCAGRSRFVVFLFPLRKPGTRNPNPLQISLFPSFSCPLCAMDLTFFSPRMSGHRPHTPLQRRPQIHDGLP